MKKTNLEKTDKPQFIILLFLMTFASVCAVLFTPGLPSIASFFQVSTGKAQLTITSYLIGYAIGQLPYGPLANRIGRKPSIYIGISLGIIGSFLCALSSSLESFELLVFARFVQALGACVGLKICFTMIGDVYNQIDATKMISRTLLAFAIVPGISMTIGGYLTQYFGWESCFYFLAVFGFFVLLMVTKLPETAKSLDRNALDLRSIVQGYSVKFKNKRLVTSGLIMGCGVAVIYIFASKAPFIGINVIGLSPDQFGMYNLFPPLGVLLGTYLTNKMAGRYHLTNVLLLGTIGGLIMTCTMLVPFILGIFNPLSLFFPIFLIYICEVLIYANVSAFGLENAKNKSNGSAVLNFLNIGVAVVAVLFAEFIYPESALALPISFMIIFIILLLLWFRLRKLHTNI